MSRVAKQRLRKRIARDEDDCIAYEPGVSSLSCVAVFRENFFWLTLFSFLECWMMCSFFGFLGCIFTTTYIVERINALRAIGGCVILAACTQNRKSLFFTYFNYPVLFGAGVTFHPSRYY
jgi:hypothetical protein